MEEAFKKILLEALSPLQSEIERLRLIIEDRKEDELLTKKEACSFVKLCERQFDRKAFKKTYLADGVSFRYRKADLLLHETTPTIKKSAGRTPKRGRNIGR